MTAIVHGRRKPIASRAEIPTEKDAVRVLKQLIDAAATLGLEPAAVELRDHSARLWRKSVDRFIEDSILPAIEAERRPDHDL